jgi:hypothetical protein
MTHDRYGMMYFGGTGSRCTGGSNRDSYLINRAVPSGFLNSPLAGDPSAMIVGLVK